MWSKRLQKAVNSINHFESHCSCTYTKKKTANWLISYTYLSLSNPLTLKQFYLFLVTSNQLIRRGPKSVCCTPIACICGRDSQIHMVQIFIHCPQFLIVQIRYVARCFKAIASGSVTSHSLAYLARYFIARDFLVSVLALNLTYFYMMRCQLLNLLLTPQYH